MNKEHVEKTTEEKVADIVKSEISAMKQEMATQLEALKASQAPQAQTPVSKLSKDVKAFLDSAEKALKKIGDGTAKTVDVETSFEVVRAISSTNFTPASDWGLEVTLPGIERPLSDNTRFNLLDYIPVGTTQAVHLKKARRGAKVGNAMWIGECELKPLISMSWEKIGIDPVKIANRIQVCDEVLEDIPELRQEIRNLLTEDLLYAISDGLLNGDPLANPDEPTGLFTEASAFNNPDAADTVDDPNYLDAINAVITSQVCMGCAPNIALMNCTDYFILDSMKDANGQYLQIPGYDRTNKTINGVRILQVPTSVLPKGEFVVFDVNSIKVWFKGAVQFKEGYSSVRNELGVVQGNDWEHNMTSFISEVRLFAWVDNVQCITKDTFVNVQSFIAKP